MVLDVWFPIPKRSGVACRDTNGEGFRVSGFGVKVWGKCAWRPPVKPSRASEPAISASPYVESDPALSGLHALGARAQDCGFGVEGGGLTVGGSVGGARPCRVWDVGFGV